MRKFSAQFYLITIIILIILFYFIVTHFVAYTNDAYITTDLIAVTPQVDGFITKLSVNNNQLVAKDTPLVEIDPTPYRMIVDQQQAALNEAIQELALMKTQADEADATLTAVKARYKLTQETFIRYQTLAKANAISQQTLDDATSQENVASANVLEANKELEIVKQKALVQEAKIVNLKSVLALANYQLSLTKMTAPESGYINHLRTYRGDYVEKGKSIFGLVVSDRFRIIANYQEYVVARLKPEQTAWVYLSTYPWTVWRGHVVSIGRGVAREPTQTDSALPYIPPVTDWIRYPYRFPVTIYLDHPPAEALHMGADASIVIFLP